MKDTCSKCDTDLTNVSTPLYTVCPDCTKLVKLAGNAETIHNAASEQTPQTDLKEDPPSAKEIEITLKRGKIRTFHSVEKVVNDHRKRIRKIEHQQEEIDQRLQRLERLIRITLSRRCPECDKQLSMTEAGMLRCPSCDANYPTNPRLENK